MDITLARRLVDDLRAALAETAPAPPPTTTTGISTPDALDRAISLAVAGDLLSLDPALVYPAPLTLPKPLRLIGLALGATFTRVTADAQLPRFLGGIRMLQGGGLFNVEVQNQPDSHANIIEAFGTWSFDRVRILGDPLKGAHRGIAAFPNGNCSVTRSIIDDCFQPSPGMDSQAIGMWQGHGLLVDDCFLRGGSETVLIGGADSPTAELMPADITIRNSTITKNAAWMTKPIGVKNALELKACRNVLIEHNTIEYSWAQGQVGYLLTLTVRNQDGNAPWSTIEDVTIQDNRLAHAAAFMSILGMDYTHPSGRMARVNVLRNVAVDLDPDKYKNGWDATDKLMLIQGGDDVTIDGNELHMTPCGSQVYFDWPGADRQKMKNARITNNKWPNSLYGVFGSEGSVNKSFPYFTDANSVLSGNSVIV